MADFKTMESNFIKGLKDKHNTPVKDAAALKVNKTTMQDLMKDLKNVPEKMHVIGECGATSAKKDVGGHNGLNGGPAKEY